MGIGITRGGGSRQLNYTANLNITDFQKRAQQIKKEFNDMVAAAKKAASLSLNPNGLTGYQQALIGLKKVQADSQLETEKLRQETQRYRAELEQGRVAQQANRTELDRLRAAEQALKNDLQQGRIAQQAFRAEIDRNRVAQQQLTATLAQGKIEQQNLRTEITRMTLARKQEVEAQRQARKAAQEVSGSYNEAQKRLRDLGNEIKSAEGGFKRLTPELKAKVKEYNELNDALKKFDAQMGNHQRNVGNYKGALRSTAEDLLGFATAYLSIGNALTYVFNQTLAFQRIRTPLSFILGSEGEADNKLAELKKFADEIGVEYFSIANSYKQFTAAARASNFDLGQSEKIFKSVAKAGAVLGLSNDTLEGTFLALQQMISKGTVQSEELRGQLSERLPGAFSLAAKAMGVTEQELGKLLKAGQVTASEMLPKLAIELDKAYGDKAGESIGGLNAELNRLYASLQAFAGEGSFLSKNLFEPIIIGAREAVKELSQMFRGSFSENIRYFFTFSNKDLANQRLAYDLRDLRKNNENAQSEAEKYSTEGKSLGDLRTKYSQITETMRLAYDAQSKFKKGLADGTLKETKDASLGTFNAIANGLNAQRKRIADAILDAKAAQKKANKETLDAELTSITAIQKRISELKKMAGSAIAGTDVYNRIQALQDRLKKPGMPTYEAEETGQKALQKQIDDAIAGSKRKQLDANQQEVDAVKQKYADLRKAAEDHNKAVDKYNNDIANKNKRKKIKVDAGGLNKAESDETDFVVDKTKAAELKTDLDKKKKLYEDYENFRNKVGKEKANERYRDLIDVDKTYRQYLDSLDDKLIGVDDKGKGSDGAGERVAQQLAVIKKERELALVDERQKNDAFLNEIRSYTEKRIALEDAMRDKVNQFEAEGNKVKAEETRKYFQDQLLALGESHVQQLDSYKRFFEDTEDLTAEAMATRLEALKADIEKLNKNPELQALLSKILRAGTVQLNQKSLDGYKALVSSLQEASSAAEGLSSGLSEGLNAAVNLGTAMINIKSSYDDFKKASKDNNPLGMLSAGIAGVSSILSVVNFVSGIFAKARQFREENKKVIEDFNNQRQIGEFDINQLYRERVRLQLELNKATLSGLKTNTTELKKQIQENAADYKRIADLLAGESFITGYKNVSDSSLQVRQVAILESLAGKSFADIEKLFMSGQLTDRAKELFSQLQKLKSEGADIDKLLAENTKSIMEAATGTTADSIADSIITGFQNGYRTAADFANDFKSLMSSATKQIFKEFVNNQELAAFYKQYADMAQNGALTVDQKANLKKLYDAMIGRINGKYEELKGITGDDFLTDPTNSSGSSSVSKTITTPVTENSFAIKRNKIKVTF